MSPLRPRHLSALTLLCALALPIRAAKAAPAVPAACAPVVDPLTSRPRLVSPDMPGAIADRPRTSLPEPPLSSVPVLPLEGELAVSQGAATYTIPIVVPPGRKLTPTVALTYSSHGGASTVGVGWSLSVEQRVHRCARVYARDASSRPVLFDDDDKLCLNGDRMVLESSSHTYGQPGAIYRLEHDDWTRIEQLGPLDDISTCFVATRRDGRRLEFGGCNDPDATELLIGSTTPWSWALHLESDLRGNEILYAYDRVRAQQVLARILYTGHRGTPGTREIVFDYVERPDVTWRHVAGATLENVARLSAITTRAQGVLARRFELTYTTSEATRRSLLSSVQACSALDANGACLPDASTLPTVLSYDQARRQFGHERLPATNPLRQRFAFLPDVDGDGRNDRIRSEYRADSGCGAPLSSHLELSGDGSSTRFSTIGMQAVFDGGGHTFERDLDLDGRADVRGIASGFHAFSSFDSSTRRMAPPTLTNIPEAVRLHGYSPLDTDGYFDAVGIFQGNVELRRQCGALDGTTFCPPFHQELISTCQSILLVQDLNGDGTSDVVVADRPSPLPCPDSDYVLLSDSSSSGSLPTFSSVPPAQLGLPPYLGHSKIKFIDLNEDGLLDVVRVAGLEPKDTRSDPDYTPDQAFSGAWVNTGGTFRYEPLSLPERKDYVLVSADVDGDGRDELLVPDTPADFAQHGAWSYFPNPGGTEPTEYYSDGYAQPTYDISRSYSAFDRTIYRWRAIDFVLEAGGSISTTGASTTLEAPANNLRFVFNASGSGGLDGFAFVQPLWGAVQPGAQCATQMVGGYIGRPYNEGYGSYLMASDASTVDRLIAIDRGAGQGESIEYRALSRGPASGCAGPLYTTDVPAASVTSGRHLVDTSMVVVARVDRPDGLGGEVSACYQYENGWWSAHGRGFQAFEAIEEIERVPGDSANDRRTRSAYHSDFPLAGRLREKAVFLASDGPGALPILEQEQVWHHVCRPSPDGVESCWTYPGRAEKRLRDLAAPRVVLQTEVTERVYDPTDLERGNLTREITTKTDDFQVRRSTVEHTYDYGYVGDGWLDKPVQRVETLDAVQMQVPPALPAPVTQRKVLTTTFDFYTTGPNVRLLRLETVQPGIPNQEIQVEKLVYDGYGNLREEETRASGAGPRRLTYGYDGEGYFRESETNPLLHSVRKQVDPRTGQDQWVEDANHLRIAYQLDGFGQILRETNPGQQPTYVRFELCDSSRCPLLDGKEVLVRRRVVSQEGVPTTIEYSDSLGRVRLKETESLNGLRTFQRTDYDRRGRVVRQTMPALSSSLPTGPWPTGEVVFEAFDPIGRPGVRREHRPDFTPPFDKAETHTAYAGYEQTITGPDGTTTRRIVDGNGLTLERYDEEGHRTRFRYDTLGELAWMDDPDGNTSTWIRDERGRVVQVTHPDAGTWQVEYDGFDQQTRREDANGDVLELEYDAIGRKRSEIENDVVRATWSYDADFIGTLSFEAGGTGGPHAFCRALRHDGFGRLEVEAVAHWGGQFSIQTAYDSAYGTPKATVFPTGDQVGYLYSPEGWAVGEYDPATGLEYRRVGSVDALGAVTFETFGNGLQGIYRHSESTGLTHELVVAGSPDLPSLLHLDYRYDDPRALLTQRTDHVMELDEHFTYDELRRVRNAHRMWWDGRVQLNGYDYDDLGNIITKSDYGSQFEYGNQARTLGANAGPHAIRSFVDANGSVVADFGYDANGNMTAGNGRTLTYDIHNKPTRIVTGSHPVAEVMYDPNGAPYMRREGTKTTWSLGDSYERVEDGGVIKERVYFGAVVLERAGGTLATRYRHLDALGSPALTTDDAGAELERRAFGPFGRSRDRGWEDMAALASAVSDHGFTGHEHLDIPGLVHMGGRVLDFNLGRFLSVDPFADVSDLQSLNSYSYVRNSSLNRVDPSGYTDEEERLTIVVKQDPVTGSRISRNITLEVSGVKGGNSFTVVANGKVVGAIDGPTFTRLQVEAASVTSHSAGGGSRGRGQASAASAPFTVSQEMMSNLESLGSPQHDSTSSTEERMAIPASLLPVPTSGGDALTIFGAIKLAEKIYAVTIAKIFSKKVADQLLKEAAENAAAARAVAPSSRALGRALEAAGHARPTGSAAHHIVAGNAPGAARARAVLERFGIGVNDAANGVFLPASRAAPNAAGAAVHSTLHTGSYYQTVNQMLLGATTRAEAEAALGAIRQSLLSGGL